MEEFWTESMERGYRDRFSEDVPVAPERQTSSEACPDGIVEVFSTSTTLRQKAAFTIAVKSENKRLLRSLAAKIPY